MDELRPATYEEAKLFYPHWNSQMIQYGIDKGHFVTDGDKFIVDNFSELMNHLMDELLFDLIDDMD